MFTEYTNLNNSVRPAVQEIFRLDSTASCLSMQNHIISHVANNNATAHGGTNWLLYTTYKCQKLLLPW